MIIVSRWFDNYRHIVFTLLVVLLHKIKHTLPQNLIGMHATHLRACLHRNYSNLARKVYKKKTKDIIVIILNIVIF